MKKAKVFISCGQLKSEEKKVGLLVQKYFEDKGFLAYI